MPKDVLSKIRRRASEMTKSNPRISYQSALKKAGKEYREGKIGKARPSRRTEIRKKVRKKVEQIRSRKVGSTGKTVDQAVKQARDRIKEELGWLLATRATATTKKEKNALAPKISELTRQLKALERK